MNYSNGYQNISQEMPGTNTSQVNDNLDFRRYLGLFFSNWYWFAAALFISGFIAYGINTYSEKLFTVSSSLLIKEDQPGSDLTGLEKILPSNDVFSSQQNLQNEIGILKSFGLNLRVMKELPDFQVTIVKLGRRSIAQIRQYKSAPFIITFDTISSQRAGVSINFHITSANTFQLDINGTELSKSEYRFGENINGAGFNFTILKRDSSFLSNPEINNRYIFWFNKPESLANSYRSKLNINPVNENATLVSLSVTGPVPLQESEYLNKLMEIYIRQGKEYKSQTAINTIKFIDEQLKTISDSLNHAENRLENFRLSNKLIDLSAEGQAVRNRLESISQERVTAELQRQYYDYLSGYIKTRNETGEIISPSVMGVTDQVLIGLVAELSVLQMQRKQLVFDFSANQPAVKLIESKIEDSRLSLQENVRNNILGIARTIKDIDSRLLEVENELGKLPGTERKLINIQRNFELNNTVYTFMLEKRSEAGITKASYVSASRIIDHAQSFNYSKIKPKEKKNYVLAIMLGIFIPGLYIFFIDQLHNKILDKRDIERGTTVPIIGFIGHNASHNELPVLLKPGSSLSESFRTIRTNLKFYISNEKKGLISVTSTISGEGKTFVSLNLSAIIAMAGKKTLLVGIDLRKPRLNKILKQGDEKGLSQYLIGEGTFEEMIRPTSVENLYFIPSGPIPPNPSELLDSDEMKLFIEKAKNEFDFVILDTPPVGIVSDALLIGNYSDMNIFVIRQKFSFKSTLELIQNIYNKKELKNLTIAVNDIRISGYYGYGLRYGYGFYEGYGYRYGYSQYGGYGYGDYHKYYIED
jgi:tyrosine-protein kinase Etk/Wzc